MFGINNLSTKHHAQNPSGLYVTTAINYNISILYLNTLLQSKAKNTFVSFAPLAIILEELETPLKNKIQNVFQKQTCFFLNQYSANKSLDKLSKDINNIQFKKNDSVVFYIPDQTILLSEHKSRIQFFKNINKLAKLKKLTISMVLFGSEYQILNRWLMEHPDLFFGVSAIHKTDSTQYIYQINYWISQGEVTANHEYEITPQSDKTLSTTIIPIHNQQNLQVDINDQHTIHIVESAIEPTQKITESMTSYTTNQVLFEEITQAHTCIIVLSIYQHQEVHDIATGIYQLRRKFGLKFKLVLREMKQCIRYSDEVFLSKIGVNLILAPNISFSRMMNMLETLQRQETKAVTPNSVDELMYLENTSRYSYKGYMDTEEFIHRCNRLIERHEQTKIQYALIKLDLLPGIEMDSCLSMCNIKRDGDIITACSSALYLLLSSVRENDIQPTLSHIFKLPIADMFRSNTTYTTPHRIKSELPEIRLQAVKINKDTASLTTTPALFTTGSENKKMYKAFSYATHKPLEL